MSARQRFYFHVGTPKSGTTYLQDVMFANQAEFARQGVELLPPRRPAHFLLMLRVREQVKDFDGDFAHQALERFAAQVRAHTLPSALYSAELMGAAQADHIAELMRPLKGYEPHLVLTVRDLARQMSSSWQQKVQQRSTMSYPDFLDAIVAGEPEGRLFRNSQLVPELLERWGTAIPPERMHVIVGAPPGGPTHLLLDRFCSVIGVDPATLDAASTSSNPTLGSVQAELLRRANLALGKRLSHPRRGYRQVGRAWMAREVLQLQQSPRPLVPERLRGWVEETTERTIEHLQGGGYQVLGDLEDLRARDSAFAADDDPVAAGADDSALLESAVSALADIMAQRHVEQARLADERREHEEALAWWEQRARELEGEPDGPDAEEPDAGSGLVARARRRLGGSAG